MKHTENKDLEEFDVNEEDFLIREIATDNQELMILTSNREINHD